LLGKSLWDISGYDDQNYQDLQGKSDHSVLCKSHVVQGEITDAVIDYLYESDEQPVS
jgi:hypothetical protein